MLALLTALTLSGAPVQLRFGTESSWTDVQFSNESGLAMRACREVEKQNAQALVSCTTAPLPAVKTASPGGRFSRSIEHATQTMALDATGVVIVQSEWRTVQRFESAEACEGFRQRRLDLTRRAAAELEPQKKFLDDLAARQRGDEQTACAESDAFKKKARPKKALDAQLYDLEARRLEQACTLARATLAVTLERLRDADPQARRVECVEAL